ncbi:MAG TPA: histidine phosphatase family protein [Candidatus Dormibacteraeota bacterium]
MSNPGSRATLPDPPGAHPARLSRLLLIRHGQSTWNDERRIQGQLDPPLSDLGREQARRLAERLAGGQYEALYTSDLARARATAEAVGAAVGLEPIPTPELREVALGEWEGLTREQLVAGYPEAWARWQSEPSWDLPPGGEGADLFEARVARAVEEIFARHPQQEVLVVAHGGVIQVALGRLLGRASHGLFPFVIDNCSISTLVRGGRRTLITGVNDVCHLAAGEPITTARDRTGGLTNTE